MEKIINDLIRKEFLIMLYVADGKIFWLRKHYRYLNRLQMLKDKVLLGPNSIGLSKGFNYITETLKQTNNMSTEAKPTTKAKEAFKAIQEQFKKAKQSEKIHQKEVTLFNKMVTKFPAKERELFADKLTALEL